MAITHIQAKRFASEKKILVEIPLHYVTAAQNKENPLLWYFLIKGQKDTPYDGGEYIGKILHSPAYPASPPSYWMLTPNGRFEANVEICLTNSRYHTGEWNPLWNINSILIGFYSVFCTDDTTGIAHIKESEHDRKLKAKNSIKYNAGNHADIYKTFNLTYLTNDKPVELVAPKYEGEAVLVKKTKKAVPKTDEEVAKAEDFDYGFDDEDADVEKVMSPVVLADKPLPVTVPAPAPAPATVLATVPAPAPVLATEDLVRPKAVRKTKTKATK